MVDARAADIIAETTLDAPVVFEGLQPLVADLDGDGSVEIVTTIADSTAGARIAVFSAAGERLATGPIDEPGWRHQLTVGPFGPDGHPELAVVRRDGNGATVAWELELEGPLTSNLTGVTRPSGGVAVGAATATTVHVWQV